MDPKVDGFDEDDTYLVQTIKIRYRGVDGLNSSSDNENIRK